MACCEAETVGEITEKYSGFGTDCCNAWNPMVFVLPESEKNDLNTMFFSMFSSPKTFSRRNVRTVQQ